MLYNKNDVLNIISNYSIDTLPHSILLSGSYLEDLNEVCLFISNKYNLQLVEYDENYNQYILPSLVVISGDSMSINDQNKLLKKLEDITENTFYIITCTNDSSIIQTIKNRTIKFVLGKYSKNDLRKFSNDDLVLSIAYNPIDIEIIKSFDINELNALCNTIIDKIHLANFSNMLSIKNKLDIKEESNGKINVTMFFRLMITILKERILENFNDLWYIYYIKTVDYYKKIMRYTRYKDQILTEYLIDMWRTFNDNTEGV